MPARLPVFVIETEPVAVSPIFIAAALNTAPEPERLIVSEPLEKALFEMVVGVAVKLAYVPPVATIVTAPTAASVARIFVVFTRSIGVLSGGVRHSPGSDAAGAERVPVRCESGRRRPRARSSGD